MEEEKDPWDLQSEYNVTRFFTPAAVKPSQTKKIRNTPKATPKVESVENVYKTAWNMVLATWPTWKCDAEMLKNDPNHRFCQEFYTEVRKLGDALSDQRK